MEWQENNKKVNNYYEQKVPGLINNKMFTKEELGFLDKRKMNRSKVRETHRWTEEETNTLLDNIISGMKSSGNSFERPTARQFYVEHCASKEPHDWMVKKHKMRHLKSAYIKAKEWKENVASELFESDKKRVCGRIKKICPYYNKLDVIFGPILNADPIGPVIMDEDTTAIDNSSQISVVNEFYEDETACSSLLKQEFMYDDEPEEIEMNDNEVCIPEDTSDDVRKSKFETNGYNSCRSKAKQKKMLEDKRNEPINIEQMKFIFEKEKFEMNHRLENRKLNLEKEKLAFEKTKFFESQKLRKYEIDKQFELKKLEIQRDERMQRLDFDQRTFEQNEN